MKQYIDSQLTQAVHRALDGFQIEVPSWGFANTGTRFGKFIQDSAATSTAEKLQDAGQVHALTGCCPTVAMHVLWDFPQGVESVPETMAAADMYGVRIGAINPNVFESQIYKHGSLANPDPNIRNEAIRHIEDCIEIASRTASRDISLWFTDGSSYPGTASIRERKQLFTDALATLHGQLDGGQRLLVEYKPFEPAFYHTDIADWGMAYILAKAAGPQAKVLVDTGHHYQAQNIEQIVAWLLSEDMLGGFHFNDRRYADDDLTLGSIDPYQVFRIFAEILGYEFDTRQPADLAYMVDQSHNLKNKVEEMIQTAVNAQELFAKAALIDFPQLREHQRQARLVEAEELYRAAFFTDVRHAIREWREGKGLPSNPLDEFRESGYTEARAVERGRRNRAQTASYA
ncbi:MAG: TIM barrel protein [Bryobacterales bacterium]|jgi:L-rhamnose isomerase/sugar isomerase|nr:TIM barrel protein [Bryobacterales bacterium]